MGKAIELKIHRQIDNLLIEKWRELWNRSSHAHPCNSPEWFLACRDAFRLRDYRIMVAQREDGSYAAVTPLAVERYYGLSVLANPGGKHLDRSAFLGDGDGRTAIVMMTAMLKGMGSFCLDEVPEDISEYLYGRDMIRKEGSVCPYINIGSDPFALMDRRKRNKLVNRVRRLSGDIVYRSYRSDKKALEAAFEIDDRSRKKQAGKPTFASPGDKLFYYELLAKFKRSFVVDVLYADNRAIAYNIGLTYKRTHQTLNTAYDAQYREMTPGKVLIYHILCRLKDAGMAVFDFGRGESVLKREFTSHTYEQFDVLYSRNPILRHLWLSGEDIKDWIRAHKSVYGAYLYLKKLL